MKLAGYHKKVTRPGLLFSERHTCGALGIEVLAGRGRARLDGRAAMLLLVSGRGRAGGEAFSAEDLVYLPAGLRGAFDYDLAGRALLARFAPLERGPEALRGPVIIKRGQALGYVRRQYGGAAHGWGAAVRGFNPKAIAYTDKLWGASRDVLAQELAMPPGHMVPVHVHGALGQPPSARDFWQAYYVWEGSARVDIGRSLREVASIKFGPGSVLVYPNGVAHIVIAG